jgi:hypothetical protein
VAKHNVGSIRVLEKCGFSLEREESVEVAGKDVAELVLVLRSLDLAGTSTRSFIAFHASREFSAIGCDSLT